MCAWKLEPVTDFIKWALRKDSLFENDERRYSPQDRPSYARSNILVREVDQIKPACLEAKYGVAAIPLIDPANIMEALHFIGLFVREETGKVCREKDKAALVSCFSSPEVTKSFLQSVRYIIRNTLLDEYPGLLRNGQPPADEICGLLECWWKRRFPLTSDNGAETMRRILQQNGLEIRITNEIVGSSDNADSWFSRLLKYALQHNLRGVLVKTLNSIVRGLCLSHDDELFLKQKRIRCALTNERIGFNEDGGDFVLLN